MYYYSGGTPNTFAAGGNYNPNEAPKISIDDLLGITDDTFFQLSDTYDKEVLAATGGGNAIQLRGTDSIFNPFHVFRFARYGAIDGSGYSPAYHRDLNESLVTDIRKSNALGENVSNTLTKIADVKKKAENPTATEILAWSEQLAGQVDGDETTVTAMPYQWNDFLWCKWYGKIPNNRLLTLRRYPLPIEDNIQADKRKLPLVPIAQAVTWWGEETGNKLSNVLSPTWGWNWTDKTAKIQDVQGTEVDASAILDALGLTQGKNEALRKILLATLFSNENNPYQATGYDKTIQEWITTAYSEEGQYWNRVRGPINVINSTKIRTEGFTYKHPISLKFSYKLRSYNNINPKIAMLDLISNFLSLTYNTAEFWGGGIRYFQKTGYIAAGLPSEKFEKGDFVGGSIDAANFLLSKLQGAGQKMKEIVTELGGLSAAELEKAAADVEKNKVVNDIVGSHVAKLLTVPLTMRSFLDGRAVGEWHLTVGNPINPIAVIGNLCLTNTAINFSDALGSDDFPLEVDFTVSLEHGRPRAKQDIESMFNLGGGGLTYTALPNPSSAYNSYGERNSIVAKNIRNVQDQNQPSPDQIAKQIFGTKASAQSIAAEYNTAQNRTGQSARTVDQASNLANYFKFNVARAYGKKFGESKVLVDYFLDLRTKD